MSTGMPLCEANPQETWAQGHMTTYSGGCSFNNILGFPSSNFSGVAYCPGGYSAVSGHVACNDSGGGFVGASHPSGSNGWHGQCCTSLLGGSGGVITVRCRAD